MPFIYEIEEREKIFGIYLKIFIILILIMSPNCIILFVFPGLDPVGMYFYNADPPVRLDASDAQFVDVIITNGGFSLEDGKMICYSFVVF